MPISVQELNEFEVGLLEQKALLYTLQTFRLKRKLGEETTIEFILEHLLSEYIKGTIVTKDEILKLIEHVTKVEPIPQYEEVEALTELIDFMYRRISVNSYQYATTLKHVERLVALGDKFNIDLAVLRLQTLKDYIVSIDACKKAQKQHLTELEYKKVNLKYKQDIWNYVNKVFTSKPSRGGLGATIPKKNYTLDSRT